MCLSFVFSFFFFNDTATTEIYTLSLHDALPISKEYIAAQDEVDPGVLVLSRFAGAAHQMGAALIVNPYDLHDMAEALHRGLTMPLGERRERWKTLMEGLERDDVTAWRNHFLDVLGAAASQGPSHAVLAALSDELGETCGLGVVVGGEIVIIDNAKVGWPLTLDVGARARLPLHCSAMGKLLLSFMPRRGRDRMIANLKLERYTEATLSERRALIAELDRVRVKRVATNNQEFIAGVIGVAVPVLGPHQRVCASIGVAAPEARMSLDHALSFVPALESAAERLSACFTTAGRE